MPLRRLRHTLTSLIKGAGALLLLGVLLYFALARTQVGRDGLRDQLERSFAQTFEGRLEIGELTGNLVHHLFARDVRLFDPSGRLLLHVDSLVARPRWRDLVRRRVSLGHLTLIRPEARLVYEADGTWNLAHTLRRRRSGTPRASWSFTSAEIRVEAGTLRSQRAGPPLPVVARGHLFDLTEARAEDVQARATIETRPDFTLIDVLGGSAVLHPLDLALRQLQGQFVAEDGSLSLNQAAAHLGQTRVSATAFLAGLPERPYLDVDVVGHRVHFDELRRLFPALPLAGAATAQVRVRGPLSQLTFESLAVEHGDSRLRAEGVLHGLPETVQLEEVALTALLAPHDLQTFVPAVDFGPVLHLDPTQLTFVGRSAVVREATLTAPRLHVEGNLAVEGSMGRAEGAILLTRPSEGTAQYEADVTARALDLAALLPERRWPSRLNGRIQLRGQGLTRERAEGMLRLRLSPSRLAGRSFAGLRLSARYRPRHLSTNFALRQQAGALHGEADVSLGTRQPTYRLALTARGLDVAPWLGEGLPRTALNARVDFSGTGTSWSAARADLSVAFDSSAVYRDGSAVVLPPHRTTLALRARGDDAARLSLSGDLATLHVHGDLEAGPLAAVSGLWTEAFQHAVQRQQRKQRSAPHAADARGAALAIAPRTERAARAALARDGLDTLALAADLVLHRPDLLAPWLPPAAELPAGLTARLHLAANADHLRLSGSATGDTLDVPGARASAPAARFTALATSDVPVEQSLSASLELEADQVHLGDQRFPQPRLTARYLQGEGALNLNTGAEGPLHVAVTAALLPDRVQATLSDFHLALGDYTWQNPAPAPFHLYADAVVVPGLALESLHPPTGRVQRLRTHGIFSWAADAAITVEAENIVLRQLSSFLRLKRPIGGLLSGRFGLSGRTQPTLTGSVDVDALSFDNRLLGRLQASSTFVPGRPDVRFEAALEPPAEGTARDVLFGTELPAIFEEQRLRLEGTFRLPQVTPRGAFADPGALDLRLAADRLDAFFFEYLFSELVEDVEGAFQGGGTITGTFARPRFDLAMYLTGGRVRIPRFNLAYELEGDVAVDEAGIKPQGLAVRDPTGGRASLSGAILFNAYRFFSFDLLAQLDDLRIMNVMRSEELPFYGQIWASGPLSLTGPVYNTLLRTADARTSPQSEVFIPVEPGETEIDPGFIVFTDSSGHAPNLDRLPRRANILDKRPEGERSFLEGLEMDLGFTAPEGSTVHLVFDPLLGDEINAVGRGQLQIQRREGEFATFGSFEVDEGTYLFTAGEVFVRRFLIDGGTLLWDGDPVNAYMDIEASYRTRASSAGLPDEVSQNLQTLIPLVIQLRITGRVAAPLVDLRLAIDQRGELIRETQFLEPYLRQSEHSTEYATSVLLTNSFLLSTQGTEGDVLAGSAFNSVSQLVGSQLNRYLSRVLPNVDFSLGVQGDEEARDLDLTYGLALRLLDERLVIRGQGVYRGLRSGTDAPDQTAGQEALEGEFVVEVRLSPFVSVEAFYRREGGVLNESVLTNTAGAGLSYEAEFSTWRRLFQRLFGWLRPDMPEEDAPEEQVAGTREQR